MANGATVTALFLRKRSSGATWKFAGCVENDDGDPRFDCTYTYVGGHAVLGVFDSDAFGWFVNTISFGSP